MNIFNDICFSKSPMVCDEGKEICVFTPNFLTMNQLHSNTSTLLIKNVLWSNSLFMNSNPWRHGVQQEEKTRLSLSLFLNTQVSELPFFAPTYFGVRYLCSPTQVLRVNHTFKHVHLVQKMMAHGSTHCL